MSVMSGARLEVHDELSIHVSVVDGSVWSSRLLVLWAHRRFLLRAAIVSFLVSVAIAFTLPKRYESSARIMPPNNSSASTAMLAALTGRALGGVAGLSSLAGGLLGGYNSTATAVELLHSGTIADHLLNRFNLQSVYHKRYRIDAAKRLAHNTVIADDKKSGVITITVKDADPRRARDLAQGYLDELNALVNRTSISSAHQERVFIDNRLVSVRQDLEQAQEQLSEFASLHATVDIKEQTRAIVDASARLKAQQIVEESSLNGLRQVYGDENVRVRTARARIGVLNAELAKLNGSAGVPLTEIGTPNGSDVTPTHNLQPSPNLRQLPRLAVPYANLYRQVQVQENVFELLTQQDELARIQEAKDIPVVSVIDVPGIPEKKSFPPRLLLIAALTSVLMICTTAGTLLNHRWNQISAADPRKKLASDVADEVRGFWRRGWHQTGDVQ